MIIFLAVEKLVAVAVIVVAIVVGLATIFHGDFWLGLLFLLGQAQSVLGHHGGHSVVEESSHLKLHSKH